MRCCHPHSVFRDQSRPVHDVAQPRPGAMARCPLVRLVSGQAKQRAALELMMSMQRARKGATLPLWKQPWRGCTGALLRRELCKLLTHAEEVHRERHICLGPAMPTHLRGTLQQVEYIARRHLMWITWLAILVFFLSMRLLETSMASPKPCPLLAYCLPSHRWQKSR